MGAHAERGGSVDLNAGTHLLDLPDDLLISILTPPRSATSAVHSAAGTCRRLRAAAHATVTAIALRYEDEDVPEALAFAATLSALRAVRLEGGSDGDGLDADVAAPLAALTQVLDLHLTMHTACADTAPAQDAWAECFNTLAPLSRLTCLSLRHRPVSDAACRRVAVHFFGLRTVSFEGHDLTDEGMSALASLPSLLSLTLKDSSIEATGAASLAQLTQLTHLDLYCSCLNAEGCAALVAGLPHLCRLGVVSLGVSSGPLALAALTALTSLDASCAGLPDASVDALACLPRLQCLNLSDPSSRRPPASPP